MKIKRGINGKYRYSATWLPLDQKDPGYKVFTKAEKLLAQHSWDEYYLLGGLDHITINGHRVRYHDRGMNGKYRDILVDTKTGIIKYVK